MFFQAVGEHEAPLVRTFVFVAPNQSGTTLNVTLEYVPPETLNEEQKQAEARVVSQRKFNAINDLKQDNIELMRYYNGLFANRVRKVDGMTIRKLAQLVSLNVAKLREMGVKPDDPLDMDPSDGAPISPEERERFSIPEEIQTRGQQAKMNILYLIQGNQHFQQFVLGVIQDVSFFQDKRWWGEDQEKNSGSGADTSSAPRSETSPATVISA